GETARSPYPTRAGPRPQRLGPFNRLTRPVPVTPHRGRPMRPAAPALFALAAALLPARAELPKPEKFDETGFVTIFDGKTLDGWRVSAKKGHSRASKNTSGGRWVVDGGAIVGSQDAPGNGGMVITEKEYGDLEVALEMNNDFGPD